MKPLRLILILLFLFVFYGIGFAQEMSASESSAESEDNAEKLHFKNPFTSFLPKRAEVIDEPRVDPRANIDEPRQITYDPKAIIPPKLDVSGAVWNTDRPQAIINDSVVDIGDTIQGAKIISIEKTGIDIMYQGQVFTIEAIERPEQDTESELVSNDPDDDYNYSNND